MQRRARILILVALMVALSLAVFSQAVAAPPKPPGPPGTVSVQILGLNDFHGNLEPPTGSGGTIVTGPAVPPNPAPTTLAGGVEYLATHINNLRAQNPNTVVVSAGDMIGATPLISALFHDEPTIEAFNLMGLDFNAVGNHEFDDGIAELLRMQRGGCHPVNGCNTGHTFEGADFKYLAANVLWERNRQTIFPAYRVKNFNGAKVAFIGMTLEGTPSIVSPSGIVGLRFQDEADTVNALVPELKRQGVETIVVLIHEGGLTTGTYDACPGISGAIVDIVERTDDEVDLFITGHTHQAYNCVIDGRPVTSAASNGRIVTKVDLTISRATGEVVSYTAQNTIVTRDVPKAPALTALVDYYRALVAPLANRVIGSITADIVRDQPTPAGESALGDVIADAQLAATASPGTGSAVVAFMNPGGIRANLLYNQISGNELPGEITYGEAFNVQPFGNNLVTMTLTGAQIDTLLEQQFDNPGTGQNRILQVSNGFSYTWVASAPTGSKVDPATIMLNGVVVDPTATYRVTVNSFMADGGDNFFILREGTNRLGGVVDTDAFEAYFATSSPVAPGPQNRITRVP